MDQKTLLASLPERQEAPWLVRLRALLLLRNLNTLFLLVALGATVLVFSLTSPYFFALRNAFNIGRAMSVIGIAASFATIVLISGGIDLSIGAVMNAAGVAAAMVLANTGLGFPAACALALLIGVAVGLLNGVLIAILGINAFITTIGTQFVVSGIDYVLSSANSELINDPTLLSLGGGTIQLGTVSIPVPLILMLLVMLLAYLLLSYTQFGKYVFAVGGNPSASRRAGIKVARIRIYVYILSGVGAAFAGLVLAGLTGAGIPYAAGDELTVIAAVVLGGTGLAGGTGTVQGTLLGVLLLGVLENGLTLLNVNASYQMIVTGAVLLTAVAIDQLKRRVSR